jgi:hypothetical protein
VHVWRGKINPPCEWQNIERRTKKYSGRKFIWKTELENIWAFLSKIKWIESAFLLGRSWVIQEIIFNRLGKKSVRVTKIENIKTELTKILRPFQGRKILRPTDYFLVIFSDFFFQIRLVGLSIYLLFILENKTEALKTDNRVMYTTYIRIMLKTAKC